MPYRTRASKRRREVAGGDAGSDLEPVQPEHQPPHGPLAPVPDDAGVETRRPAAQLQEGLRMGRLERCQRMQFVRGQPQDFDRWAKQEFCTELWAYEKCLPYFKRFESYTPGLDPRMPSMPTQKRNA